jgi:methylenetetrahydrofolate dehydrogenase (NADP+)/methenyltetrahydrofolate cyclohydrolase
MSAVVLDGKALAAEHRRRTAERIASLRSRGAAVRLDAVLASAGDSAARVYAENQGKTCRELGVDHALHEVRAGAAFDEVAALVRRLSADSAVTAIMVHLPLPEGVDAHGVQALIDPGKDVEGVNPVNIGNIVYGERSLMPCTSLAAMRLIEHAGVGLRGKTCVVVGASDIVGKPIALLMMRADATVVSCNVHTRGLADWTRRADVLVSAAGKPGLITGEMVKPGAVVIDVGTSRVAAPAPGTGMRTVGDVAYEEVREVAGWITPSPGGVGPMTVAMLMANVAEAAERRAGRAG